MRPQVLAIDVAQHFFRVEPCYERVVGLMVRTAPAHGVENEAALVHAVDDTRADKLGNGGGAVMGSAGLVVKLGGGLEDLDGDAVLREEDGEEQAGGAGADYDYLLQSWLVGVV